MMTLRRSARLHSTIAARTRIIGLGVIAVVLVGGVAQPGSAVSKKPRFKLALDASTLTVGRNGSSSVTVLVTRVGTFEGPIRLSSSTRKGLKMIFDENPLEGDDTDLVATADGTATIGSTTLTVSGSDGRSTVKVRLKVKVTAGLPAVAATTVAATTVAATTVAGTTTTIATATTTTTIAGTTTTTGPPAAVGDLIITRKVSQTVPCAPALPAGTVNANVRASFSNADTSARLLSWVTPGTCAEAPAIPFTVSAGGLGAISIPFGSLVLARSAGTAGNPIRRVMAVVNAASLSFIVGATANLTVQCSAGTTSGGLLVPLSDGQQFVLNNVPAGASCKVTAQYDTTPTGSIKDNSGLAADNTAQVPGRPAACVIATIATAVPGPTGCYAEFVHNS